MAAAQLMAVAVDGVPDFLRYHDVRTALPTREATIPSPRRLHVARSLKRGLTPLGVKFSLRWAGLDRRSFVAILPLVNGPAYAEPHTSDGEQHDGRDKPLLQNIVLPAFHYSHER